MNHNEFSWTGSNGSKIFAQYWQPENTKAVVALVHGLGEHSGRYQPLAETFGREGYAVMAFDLPGHGKSEGKRGHSSYDEIHGEIDCLLMEAKKRYPGKPVFLYGHSLGGALVASYLVKKKPAIQGAVITSPGLATGTKVPASKLLLAKILGRMYPSFTMANGLDQNNLSRDAAIIKAYQDDPLVHNQISTRLGLDLLTRGSHTIEHAGEINIPVLVVQGSKDTLVSPAAARKFAKAIPASLVTYQEWEGLYHETHNETTKQDVLAYTLAWMDRLVAPRPLA